MDWSSAEGGEEAVIINSLFGIMFWVAVVDLYVDWRYVSRGGVRPSAPEKRYLWIGIGGVAAADLALTLGGVDAYAAGRFTAWMLSVVLILWSLRRRMIRRLSPTPKGTEQWGCGPRNHPGQ